MNEFLLEIISGEIPATIQKKVLKELHNQLSSKLHDSNLKFTQIDTYITPCRLVGVVHGLPEKTTAYTLEFRGPRVNSTTGAIEGFLKNKGRKFEELEKKSTPKGEFYFSSEYVESKNTIELLPSIIKTIIKDFYWEQTMRWGTSKYSWIRPIKRGCAVFAKKPVNFSFNLSDKNSDDDIIIKFDNITHGHNTLSPSNITISSFSDYQKKLRENFVIIDPQERENLILRQMDDIFSKYSLTLKKDKKLLDEVVGLVEYPECLIGKIDKKFMQLPHEILTTSMRVHQKYFSVLDVSGNLAPYFVVVANIKANNFIVAGNENVLKARLSDAHFFYQQDQQKTCDSWQKEIGKIVFHKQLGSMANKQDRLVKIISQLDIAPNTKKYAIRAAELCKIDIVSSVVHEFPELQGIMGKYYTKDETDKVSIAIGEQYLPKGLNDILPQSNAGQILCLADRLDTLVGFFLLGLQPTGSKDPFALRRAVLGVIRILEKFNLDIPESIITDIQQIYFQETPNLSSKNIEKEFFIFFNERLKTYWQTNGINQKILPMVSDEGIFSLKNKKNKIEKLQLIIDKNPKLIETYQRAKNILNSPKNIKTINIELLLTKEENKLYNLIINNQNNLNDDCIKNILIMTNDFMDNVTINDNNVAIKENRMLLLNLAVKYFENIAEFSKI